MTEYYKSLPNYDDDSDYNTNANSYYKDLARKQKLIKLLAKRIWEYDERLDERLDDLENVLQDYLSQWDNRIENLDDEVSHIFVEWLNDGTLEQIINDDVLGNKADKTYVDELNEDVTEQLTHTETKLDFNPNAEHPLYIPCSTESEHAVWDQTTHPDVKYFPNGWNGYKYWMVHTPYPYTNDFYENPEVVASNDGVRWEVPEGLNNPIDSVSESQSENGEHFSDGALVHNTNSNTLEVWYRWRNKNTAQDRFYRMVSTNGVDWENKELVYSSSKLSLSPTVLFEDDKYKMYMVNGSYQIVYMECDKNDVGNWVNEKIIPFQVAAGERIPRVWHIHILKERNDLYHLTMAESDSSIYYASSTDGKSFTNAKEIIKPSTGHGRWDNRHLYRGTLVKVNNVYRLYYGGAGNSPKRWRVGLAEGSTPYTLVGSDNVDRYGHRYVDRVKGAIGNFRSSEGNTLSLTKNEYEEAPQVHIVDSGRTGFRLVVADEYSTLEVRTDNNQKRGNIKAQELFVNEIKPNTGQVIQHGKIELRGIDDLPPVFKLLNVGVSGVNLSTTKGSTLEIIADNEEDSGILKTGHVIFGDTDVSSSNGAVRYNETMSKLQLLSEGIWNNLNNYVPDPPTASTSKGYRGDYATDENYLYVCHSLNNWLRFEKDSAW